MANALYTKFKEAILKGEIDLTSDTIKVALVDTGGYTFAATHQFLSDIGSNILGTAQTLANATVTNGVFDADDVVFTEQAAGIGTLDAIEALVIYKDTGTAATSNLIAYYDTATGLPVNPNGGDITITWDAGANKIFAIG
ncbi:hypothetical protein [Roseibium sediminis]|uniref:hypothetical protein n=1 Tax=Roseibium sediminis TaxID=1775174 RepID=UPI00123DBEEE|nr:hypothetical protein [Roseibium sediminis]